MKLEPTSSLEETNEDSPRDTDCITYYKNCYSCGTGMQYTCCRAEQDYEEKLQQMCDDCTGSNS